MPLFEFDEGRLVPARLGHTVREDVDGDVLDAVRAQVLEVIQRPLFPVTWQADGHAGSRPSGGAPGTRLTAMDGSGQVVTVEVVERLDAASLVDSLSRAGRHGDLGWSALSELYPRGPEAFRREWNLFRESMPPRPTPGPRLVVVAGTVVDEVRPALEVLTDSGVVVHEISLRELGDGRRFVEVTELRADAVVDGGKLLTAGERTVEISASPSDQAGTQAAAPRTQVNQEATPSFGVPVRAVEVPATDVRVEGNGREDDGGKQDDGGNHADHAEPEIYGAADRELAEIAAALGDDTQLLWVQLRRGIRYEATLTVDGFIRLADGATFLDPDAAAIAVSGREGVDGWRVWRFGETGPSLADAREELAWSGSRGVRGNGQRRA